MASSASDGAVTRGSVLVRVWRPVRAFGDAAHTLPGTSCRRPVGWRVFRQVSCGCRELAVECKVCSSVNVQSLSLFWEGLPAESPLKDRYGPPTEVPGQFWQSLLAVAAGIAFLLSGTVLLGLLVAVGGLVWGTVGHAGVERYRGALAEWKKARLCLNCTGQF